MIMVGPKQVQAGKWSVSLSHMEANNFPSREYTDLDKALIIDHDNHSWSSYFQCALKRFVQDEKVKDPASFNALVHGTVPLSSGLSSSAALVCASGLALAHANKLTQEAAMTAPVFAQQCIEAERYVGTMSGGMDQAINILAR